MATPPPKAKPPKEVIPKQSPALINRSKTHWPSLTAVNKPKTQRKRWLKVNG